MENLFVGTSSFYHFSVLQLHIEPSQSPKHALFRAADPVTVSTTFADVEFRNVTLQSPVLSILPDAPQMPADALRCSYEQLMNHECSGRNGLLRFWCFDEQNLAANAWNLSFSPVAPPNFLVFAWCLAAAMAWLRSFGAKRMQSMGCFIWCLAKRKKRLDSTESSYEELEAHVETRTSVALVRWVCVRTILWLARILGYNY